MKSSILKYGALLAASLLSFNAHALSISGYGVYLGSVDPTADLQGIGNTDKSATKYVFDGTLTNWSYMCWNNGQNIAPGQTDKITVVTDTSGQVSPDQVTGKGKATVGTSWGTEGYIPDSYCNPNNKDGTWSVVPGSTVATQVNLNIDIYQCSVKSVIDPTTGLAVCPNDAWNTTPSASLTAVCALNPVLRDANGLPLSGQVYSCLQTSP